MEQRLNMLFEETLMNNSESLFKLQKLYFNPKQSPEQVCISVNITVGNIISYPDPDRDPPCRSNDGKAFTCQDLPWFPTACQWQVISLYTLRLMQAISDGSGTSQLGVG